MEPSPKDIDYGPPMLPSERVAKWLDFDFGALERDVVASFESPPVIDEAFVTQRKMQRHAMIYRARIPQEILQGEQADGTELPR